VAEHEHRPHRGGVKIGTAEIGLERHVVAEPLRLRIGIHMATTQASSAA
jgi:hypothetical protein